MNWVLDHSNKASIAIKPVVIFLLVEGLAFHNLEKVQHLRSAIKPDTIKRDIPVVVIIKAPKY